MHELKYFILRGKSGDNYATEKKIELLCQRLFLEWIVFKKLRLNFKDALSIFAVAFSLQRDGGGFFCRNFFVAAISHRPERCGRIRVPFKRCVRRELIWGEGEEGEEGHEVGASMNCFLFFCGEFLRCEWIPHVRDIAIRWCQCRSTVENSRFSYLEGGGWAR